MTSDLFQTVSLSILSVLLVGGVFGLIHVQNVLARIDRRTAFNHSLLLIWAQHWGDDPVTVRQALHRAMHQFHLPVV